MQLRSTTPFIWAGALAVLFGIVALSWPLHTAAAVAMLWGVYAVADGIVHILIGTRAGAGGARGWLIGTGVLGVLVGLAVFALPGLGTTAVVWVLAAWLLLRGVFLLMSSRNRPGGALSGLGGVLWIVAAVVLFLNPTAGAATLSVLAGIFALVFGAILLAGALFFRSVGNRLRAAQAQAQYDAAGMRRPDRAPGFGGVRQVEDGDRRDGRGDGGNVIEGETK